MKINNHFYTLYKYNEEKNDIQYIKEYPNLKEALKDLKDYYKKSQVYANITTSLEELKILKNKNLVLFKERGLKNENSN